MLAGSEGEVESVSQFRLVRPAPVLELSVWASRSAFVSPRDVEALMPTCLSLVLEKASGERAESLVPPGLAPLGAEPAPFALPCSSFPFESAKQE